jgi:flagellar protein FlbD
MILLHHFGSEGAPFYLNPELITTVEAKPDTIVHLITGQEMYIRETPIQLVELVHSWRSSLFSLDATFTPPEELPQ